MTAAGARSNPAEAHTDTRAVAFSVPARAAAAAMTAAAALGGLWLAALLVFSPTPINPLKLTRSFAAIVLAPWLASALVSRACTVRTRIEGGVVSMETSSRRIEVPLHSIAAAEPWRVPLPAPGFSLRLRSGRRFDRGMVLRDPAAFLAALANAGAAAEVRRAAAHPTMLYARSRSAARSRWDNPIFKFVVFSLVPTLPLFRLHQYIAYGGTFGEYYQYGLKAYLLGFAVYWGMFAVYLALYTLVLRVAAEVIALWAAWVAPSREARVRRAAELVHRVLYYGAVPVILIMRLWPW